MPELGPTLELLNDQDASLQVRFERQRDRFGHAIVVVHDAAETVLARSFEGMDIDPFPPSPALQSQYADGGRGQSGAIPPRVLLVGMSGRNHWSLSVVADAAQGAILFEVACRIVDLPTRLGCRYEAPQPKSGWVLKGGLHLGEPALCQVRTRPIGEHLPPTLSVTQATLEVVPHEFIDASPKLKLPTTIRWAYGIQWIGPANQFTAAIHP